MYKDYYECISILSKISSLCIPFKWLIRSVCSNLILKLRGMGRGDLRNGMILEVGKSGFGAGMD